MQTINIPSEEGQSQRGNGANPTSPQHQPPNVAVMGESRVGDLQDVPPARDRQYSNLFRADHRRNPRYQPGEYITSASMDQNRLECYYCCGCCFWKKEMAEATFLDVYTNGVSISQPVLCCCLPCFWKTAVGKFQHYDDWAVFDTRPIRAGHCSPCPFCCIDCFGLYGEALVMRGRYCMGRSFFGMKNEHELCSWCPCISWYMPMSVMYGLGTGEANRIAAVISTAADRFHRRWPLLIPPRDKH